VISYSEPQRNKTLRVMVIAANRETATGLQQHLRGLGISVKILTSWRNKAMVPLVTTVLVLFPDEFALDAVVERICTLRARRPWLLIILVTLAAPRYGVATAADARSVTPVVLPKPSFGWTIVDAIRAHAGGDAS
jgi:hypothetical protein